MKILTAFCWIFILCITGPVKANSIEVSPTVLQFQPGQSHKSIRISNRGKSPIVVQVRSFSWEQNGDDDRLLGSSEIALSPPIFTLQPGITQTLRVMLRNNQPLGNARQYRLLIDDITPSPVGQIGSRMVIRMSLPVFTEPTVALPGQLLWKIDSTKSDSVILKVTNDSSTYQNIRTVELSYADGSTVAASPLASNTYILPGATRHWGVPNVNKSWRGPIVLNFTTVAGVVSKVVLAD